MNGQQDNDYEQGVYKNIKVREVDYGFGWTIEGDPSTQTIDGILNKLDNEFEELNRQNKDLIDAVKQLMDSINSSSRLTAEQMLATARAATTLKYLGF
jgi:arsenate reductase-like glutaredoxin family protein